MIFDAAVSGVERVARIARGGPFSSELTPAELGLCRGLGARPLAQVMGACAYTIGVSGAPVLGDPGYREYFGRGRVRGPVMFELRRVSAAYNQARDIALQRMGAQAAHAGPHLVVGVDVRLTEDEVADVRSVQYVVSGTAIAFAGQPARPAPRLTRLSIMDCWCLQEAGFEPAGLTGATVIYFARPSLPTLKALGKRRRSAPPNQELPDLSAATSAARDICQKQMEAQARHHGGVGILATTLDLKHGLGSGLTPDESQTRHPIATSLHLTVHGLGEAVRPASHTADTHRAGSSVAHILWLD